MKRTIALATAALLGAALAPHSVSAQTYPGPRSCANVARGSWYGTVEAVRNGYITLKTNSGEGWVHVNTQNAHINYNGQSLRPGVWAGVFGCDAESNNSLVAENITLSSSQSTYPGNHRTSNDTTIQGRITAIRPGRILIATNDGHGNTWVNTNAGGLQTGQWVSVNGRFESGDRSFDASSISVQGQPGYNGATTLEGRIENVQAGRVEIASTGGHGRVWVVTNASGLRTGELIRAQGTFSNGNQSFIATNITIESM